MHSLPILDDLPAGYCVEESPGGLLAVSVDVARLFHEAGFGPEHDGPLEPSDLAGRAPLFQLELAGERFVVRRFRHGGVFRWLWRTRYLDPERPFRELIVSNALQRSGIRTPQVVAARARMALCVGWHLDLVTRRVEGTRDLAEVLEAIRSGEISQRARAALFRTAGILVRELHGQGLVHADLNPRNLLVDAASLEVGAPVLWVLDLDTSGFVEELPDFERRANLRRLLRAVLRRESRGRPFLRATDFARFFRGYDQGGRRWKEDWRTIASDHRRAGPFHRAGWLFEKLLGDGPERRDGKAVVRG